MGCHETSFGEQYPTFRIVTVSSNSMSRGPRRVTVHSLVSAGSLLLFGLVPASTPGS